MIRRFVFGEMIETEAILEKPQAEGGAVPFLCVDEEAMTFSYSMEIQTGCMVWGRMSGE